ncbi:MAG: hypothetical protein AAFO81_09230 [Pseudomonadota bacterium]
MLVAIIASTGSHPEITQALPRLVDFSALMALTRAAEQEQNCLINLRKIDAHPSSELKLMQAASQVPAFAKVIIFLQRSKPALH